MAERHPISFARSSPLKKVPIKLIAKGLAKPIPIPKTAREIKTTMYELEKAGTIELTAAITIPNRAVCFCPIFLTITPLTSTNTVTNIETIVVNISTFVRETLLKVFAIPGMVAVITLAACSTIFKNNNAIINIIFLVLLNIFTFQ